MEEIKKCCESCEFCRKLKKPPLKPIVGFPMAQEFSEVVCMDLKEVGRGLWILHSIDAATRYTNGVLIKNKKKDTVVKEIFEN